MQCLRGITSSDLQEDYAQRAAREILRVVEKFCTPLGDVTDESLYRKLCIATKGIVADGALQKTAHFLKLQAMPNVVLVLRDRGACHSHRLQGAFASNRTLRRTVQTLVRRPARLAEGSEVISFESVLRFESCSCILHAPLQIIAIDP